MEGLHAFSTFYSAFFKFVFYGFILLVLYLIYALKGKKYYNNVISLTIIYLIFTPPVIGSIDHIARILIKCIILIPIIIFFTTINIVIYFLIKNKKIVFEFLYDSYYQLLYRVFLLINIVLSIISIFRMLLYNGNIELFYCTKHILTNLYISIIISTMLMYLFWIRNRTCIKRSLLNLIFYITIFDVVYTLLSYLFLNIIKINIGNVFYLSIYFIKWFFAGIIFVKNIDINNIKLLSKIKNDRIKYIIIMLVFAVLINCAIEVPPLIDTLLF